MKTISEKIMVMQAFEKGLKIEQVSISDGNCFWESNESPSFDWEKYDYRIKEEPSLVPFDGSDAFSLLHLNLYCINGIVSELSFIFKIFEING